MSADLVHDLVLNQHHIEIAKALNDVLRCTGWYKLEIVVIYLIRGKLIAFQKRCVVPPGVQIRPLVQGYGLVFDLQKARCERAEVSCLLRLHHALLIEVVWVEEVVLDVNKHIDLCQGLVEICLSYTIYRRQTPLLPEIVHRVAAINDVAERLLILPKELCSRTSCELESAVVGCADRIGDRCFLLAILRWIVLK